jgi:hypothetical protein
MFENTNLVVVGDSFIYGHLEKDLEPESCHARSWVSRLARIGNFKSHVNLGAPGGSNIRTHRVLLDYICNHYDSNSKYLFIYAISDLTRFELPFRRDEAIKYGIFTRTFSAEEHEVDPKLNVATIGTWIPEKLISNDTVDSSHIAEFINTYYSTFNHSAYAEKMLGHQLLAVKGLFDSLGVDYQFAETTAPLGTLKKYKFLGQSLPTIDYTIDGVNYDIGEFISRHGFEIASCGHFNAEANEFLANYIYSCLKTKY